jgi:plastocyanin
MKRIGMLAVAAVVAAFVAGNGGAATPKLRAMVSDPVNISLTFGGKKVTSLKAGKYTIVVRDIARDHDFHLTGPGLNRSTTVGGTGTSRWNVTLGKGTYKYVCDAHSTFMKGSFTVK